MVRSPTQILAMTYTSPYNEYPEKFHFIKEKMGFSGIRIIFLILTEKHPHRGGSYEHPQYLFAAKISEISPIIN